MEKAISAHSFKKTGVGGDDKDDMDRHNAAWKTIEELILRPCLAKAAELPHRRIKSRHRPLATASPVGRAILAHILEYTGVSGSDNDDMERDNAT